MRWDFLGFKAAGLPAPEFFRNSSIARRKKGALNSDPLFGRKNGAILPLRRSLQGETVPAPGIGIKARPLGEFS